MKSTVTDSSRLGHIVAKQGDPGHTQRPSLTYERVALYWLSSGSVHASGRSFAPGE